MKTMILAPRKAILITLLATLPASLNAQELLKASANGDAEQVKFLLSQGADVNGRGNKGQTPLMLAALNGREAVVEVLLGANADVDSSAPRSAQFGPRDLSPQLGNCYTASMLAAITGHKRILERLLATSKSSPCAPAGLFVLSVLGRKTESANQRELAAWLQKSEPVSSLAVHVASIRGHRQLASELALPPLNPKEPDFFELEMQGLALVSQFDGLLDDLGVGD